ncbi:hypothetical protein [Winogradskyella sp. SM1960]|uniref:hypothetical protein n=1 Tax=Winogradskyella sp. SM1960 TaxID=2865955 RepID=UPI001CD703A2|nr:hypothetical protein [Winogradskyella sp. SM1960]
MNKLYILIFLVAIFSCERRSTEDSSSVIDKKEKNIVSEVDTLNVVPKTNDKKNYIAKVKIYLENTLSMYGYLPEKKVLNTDFRNAVNELIINSKTNYSEDNTDLFLINNTSNRSVSIKDNLDNIDEETLGRLYKKGRGTSDFDELFKKILLDWKKGEIIVFIADFIYSPKSTDVETGLDQLRMNIASAFQNIPSSEAIATSILHFESTFKGTYYDVDNTERESIKKRPYYIFIIGNEDNVGKYTKEVSPKLKRYNLKNNYQIIPSEIQIREFSALPFTLNKGQFALNSSKGKTVTIENALNQGSSVELAVSINLDDIPISEDYLIDLENYTLNTNKAKIVDVGKIEDNQIRLKDGTLKNINPGDMSRTENSTHVLLLSLPNTYNGNIEITLDKNIPKWIDNVSIKEGEDDRDVETNVLKQSQTFGFKHIVEGITEAQKKSGKSNQYFQITLKVNQEKASTGLGTIVSWFIFLLILFIIGMIIYKNKQRK